MGGVATQPVRGNSGESIRMAVAGFKDVMRRPGAPPPGRASPALPGVDWLRGLRAYLAVIAAGNFIWETLHLPLYTIWWTGTLGENAFAVVHCTLGDLLIALSALTLSLVLAGDRDWPARRFRRVTALAMTFGIGYTVFSEWLNIVVRAAWAYSEFMPVLSIFGVDVGLSPGLQWVVVPLVAMRQARRSAGCISISEARI